MVSKSVLILGLVVVAMAVLVTEAKPGPDTGASNSVEFTGDRHRVRRAARNVMNHAGVAAKSNNRGDGDNDQDDQGGQGGQGNGQGEKRRKNAKKSNSDEKGGGN